MKDIRFVFVAISILMIALLVTIVLTVFSVRSALDNATRATNRANVAVAQSVQAKQLSQAVSAARLQSLTFYCAQQNQRHDATVKLLNKLVREAHKQPSKAGIRATLAFIDALAPHQNCPQVVERQLP